MPRPLRQPKPTGGFASAQIDDARFILNATLGKVNASGKLVVGQFDFHRHGIRTRFVA